MFWVGGRRTVITYLLGLRVQIELAAGIMSQSLDSRSQPKVFSASRKIRHIHCTSSRLQGEVAE